jgi:hypothetical protein
VLIRNAEQIDPAPKLDEDVRRERFKTAGQGALHAAMIRYSRQMARLRTRDPPGEGELG